MSDETKIKAAIVDHRLGNLYSVKLACEYVGMQADVTDQAAEILSADVVILPGVGAYEDAMMALNESGLTQVLHEVAACGTSCPSCWPSGASGWQRPAFRPRTPSPWRGRVASRGTSSRRS